MKREATLISIIAKIDDFPKIKISNFQKLKNFDMFNLKNQIELRAFNLKTRNY